MTRSCQNKTKQFLLHFWGSCIKNHKRCHCEHLWEKFMKCILAIRSEMKIKFGCWGFAASHVQGLWQAMVKESEVFVYLRKKFSQNKWSQEERREFCWSTD